MTWDTQEWRTVRDTKLREWFLGNEHAVRVCVQISHIAEVWDDLVDGDRKPSDTEVAHAFQSAMIHLQTNPFYMANHGMLMGVIVTAINAWHDANAMQESESGDERMQAFFLRNLGCEVATLCAFLVGGFDHMRKISLEMRAFFRHESYYEWEHRHVAV